MDRVGGYDAYRLLWEDGEAYEQIEAVIRGESAARKAKEQADKLANGTRPRAKARS